jgi:hypothetical protein
MAKWFFDCPLCGRLNPEQIYSPEAPNISANIKQPGDVFANKFKVCCITETWLNDTILSHNLFPDSCCVFRTDRDYLTSIILNVGVEC